LIAKAYNATTHQKEKEANKQTKPKDGDDRSMIFPIV
jgi:hypothetical protein